MTVAQLINKAKRLPTLQTDIVFEAWVLQRGSSLPKLEQFQLADIVDGLDCDGGFVYKITEA